MGDPRQSKQQSDVRDGLALDVEKVADLEPPCAVSYDEREGKRQARMPGREATTIGDHEL
jgi:hypothetical protein